MEESLKEAKTNQPKTGQEQEKVEEIFTFSAETQ